VWLTHDYKVAPLKRLQGKIWKSGFETGAMQAEVYPDVPIALRQWHAAGHPLCIYSSGSVGAQQLYFRYSNHGDLSPYLSGYFDLETAGSKLEAASYQRIQAALAATYPQAADAGQYLFLSDNPGELAAATVAGMQVAQILREGVVPDNRYPQYPDFLAVPV
jgi:enolase-phosphatase E1